MLNTKTNIKLSTKTLGAFLILSMLSVSSFVSATEVTKKLQQEYLKQGAKTFSAERGKKLWEGDHQGRSCTQCHTKSVKNFGKHKKTGKVIKPMAPSVNPKRLSDRRKVKKWLLRNCKWTLKRECTPQEKGDILMWLSQQ